MLDLSAVMRADLPAHTVTILVETPPTAGITLTTLLPLTYGGSNLPAIAVSLADNSVTVAWIYGQATTDQGKVFVRTRSSGGSWSSEQQVSAARAWTSTSFGINIDRGPSLVIASDGGNHLIYMENYDGSGDYGRVHYVVNTGSGWTDQALGMYTHAAGITLNSAGVFDILGTAIRRTPSPMAAARRVWTARYVLSQNAQRRSVGFAAAAHRVHWDDFI